MTEDEAKQKWCPFARLITGVVRANVLTGASAPHNRWADAGSDDAVYPDGARCIGSACMAWRWSAAKDTEAFLELVRERVANTKENFATATASSLQEHRKTFERTEGACGLAGRE